MSHIITNNFVEKGRVSIGKSTGVAIIIVYDNNQLLYSIASISCYDHPIMNLYTIIMMH